MQFFDSFILQTTDVMVGKKITFCACIVNNSPEKTFLENFVIINMSLTRRSSMPASCIPKARSR